MKNYINLFMATVQHFKIDRKNYSNFKNDLALQIHHHFPAQMVHKNRIKLSENAEK